MPLKKDFKFSEHHRFIADVSFSLSHPARLVILELLREHSFLNVTDLERVIPLSKGTISQHLDVLRRLNFIEAAEREDGTVGYTLQASSLHVAMKSLGTFAQAA